jgi:hypothetical protein
MNEYHGISSCANANMGIKTYEHNFGNDGFLENGSFATNWIFQDPRYWIRLSGQL